MYLSFIFYIYLEEEAQSKAKAILEMFPGDTLFKKSAYATLTGGLVSFLVSKGIYVPNEETLILVAFLIMSRLAYVKLAGPIGTLFETYITVEICLFVLTIIVLSGFKSKDEGIVQSRARSAREGNSHA